MTRFTVYRAKDGWRWRAKASNGLIVAESGEAYTRKHSALRALNAFASSFLAWILP